MMGISPEAITLMINNSRINLIKREQKRNREMLSYRGKFFRSNDSIEMTEIKKCEIKTYIPFKGVSK